jgi:site-specific recombinase XerD
MKITNKSYREFLDSGMITLLKQEQIEKALQNVKGVRGRYVQEGRGLLIGLYYTGGRPVEVLRCKGVDVEKEGNYVKVKLEGAKHGLTRIIYLPERLTLVKEFYNYARSVFPEQLLFYHYANKYVRKLPNGKERVETTNKIYYYISKWFTGVIAGGITPYFLRHNRFSSLSMAGIKTEEIQQLKGSKTIEGVRPYLHLSSRTMKEIAKKIK